ncbi:MAG TPA: DnaB-like helicase C-terminal domain-containing protein [Rhizobiaceae bacterium]|nr:DnaB-like helicase C-terminal domain-containing protein [Rhizobiaceae bacterium]
MTAYMSIERLPDNLEAEAGLLGSILLDNATYWRVAGFLKAEHFQDGAKGAHGVLYDVFGQMIAEARPVTPITVKPYIEADLVLNKDPSDPLTFFGYVCRLQADAFGTMAAYENGRSIIEMWARRQLIARLEEAINLARHMPIGMTPDKIIGQVADDLTSIAQEGNERAAAKQYGVVLPNAVGRVQRESGSTSARIPWFLPEVTQALGDIRRGNLIGLMSDSGGGKTSFSLQQCHYAATQGFKAAFFSIEITEEEAALQAAAQQSRISLERIDAFTLNTTETSNLEKEMILAGDLPFFIVGFGECSLTDIRIQAEAMVKRQGLDLIVIDHAKMITLPNPKDMFAERINALYRGLKALAKSLNVAIVILIQRNDDWKKRWQTGGNFRPVMGDAYGGGSIKQSLDVWFSIYRPEPLYRELIPTMPQEFISQKQIDEGKRTKKQQALQKLEESIGKAAIINHKRRRGESGRSPQIAFDAEYTMFRSLISEAGTEPDFFDEAA